MVRDTHQIERRLIASAMRSHASYATVVAAGVDEFVFDATTRQRVWHGLEMHYERSTTAPPPEVLRSSLGTWADSLTEIETAEPYAIGDLTVAAEELLHSRCKRSLEALGKQVQQALAKRDFPTARRIFEQLDELDAQLGSNVVPLKRKSEQLAFRSTPEIFSDLPEPSWVVRELHIGPGRPTELVGVGFSAKTLSLQSMALAVATGRSVWEHFEARSGVVRHIDHEQGFSATARRYQRLAIGHGIDPAALGDRLSLCALPRVTLASADALDAYTRAAEGAALLVVDSLRAATPGIDENGSEIREYVDLLLRVSERTGAAIVFIHHAGKAAVSKDSSLDRRTIGRGSIAIFDGAGCVLNLDVGKTNDAPKRVHQSKTPPDAEGNPVPDFMLAIEDVALGDNPRAGVRVVYRPLDHVNCGVRGNVRHEADLERLLQVIRESPGANASQIAAMAKMQKQRALSLLAGLLEARLVVAVPRTRGSNVYRLGESQ